MSELASSATDYSVLEHESPDVMAANLRVGSRLWASATVFFFFVFLFAYFYLRSLNSHGLWRPAHVDPPQTIGIIVTVAIVLAAALLRFGYRDHVADRRGAWRVKGAIALGVLLVAVAAQIVGWATQGFGPTEGGYASVYLGWTGFQALFVLGLAYWAETTLATSIRYRRTPTGAPGPGEASGDSDRSEPDIHDPLSLVGPALEAVSFYALLFAVLAVIAWVILYLV
jgi:heme/copper-type cytochrome/quinol oxidase subunit 3